MWEKHCKQLLIRNKALISAVFLSFIFLLLYLTFGQIRHGSLDDYFMSSVLTGAYGSAYDVHTYFVNAAYGIFLKPFYVLFPKVGWYFLFELAGTFCAFTTFAYLVIHRLGSKYGIIVSAILLAALTPDFYSPNALQSIRQPASYRLHVDIPKIKRGSLLLEDYSC